MHWGPSCHRRSVSSLSALSFQRLTIPTRLPVTVQESCPASSYVTSSPSPTTNRPILSADSVSLLRRSNWQRRAEPGTGAEGGNRGASKSAGMAARNRDARRWVHGGKDNDFPLGLEPARPTATSMNLLQPLAQSTRAAELNSVGRVYRASRADWAHPGSRNFGDAATLHAQETPAAVST